MPHNDSSWLAAAGRTTGESALQLLTEKRYSAVKVAALVAVLSESGVQAQAALAGTGLTVSDLSDPRTLTSTQQFLAATRSALRLVQRDDLGLRMGQRLHASSFGMYGYALLCSSSMAEAFDTAVRYQQLSNGVLRVSWSEVEDTASWTFPTRAALGWPDDAAALYRCVLDMAFTVHVTVIKDVMGAWCLPARAQFSEPEPPHAAALAAALECPLLFDQAENRLSYPAAWLQRAPQLANPITAAQVSAQCAKLVEELRWHSGITRRVFQELTRTPGQFPAIEDIAESLCMTSRTLRRKLEAEGTSYSDLLNNVRKSLAIDYLGSTEMSAEDIAAALGFSEAVGFRHAFKRWTGTTPNEYRRDRLLRRGVASGH